MNLGRQLGKPTRKRRVAPAGRQGSAGHRVPMGFLVRPFPYPRGNGVNADMGSINNRTHVSISSTFTVLQAHAFTPDFLGSALIPRGSYDPGREADPRWLNRRIDDDECEDRGRPTPEKRGGRLLGADPGQLPRSGTRLYLGG